MSCLASCCAAATCGLCSSVASGITRRSARLAYCGLFGLSLIVSWIIREVGYPLLKEISWINTSPHNHSKEWFQTQAVLRVSLGNFLFFAVFALIMIGVKDQNDRRDSWHHGGWIAKMVVWLLVVVLMFFLPNIVITIYGQFPLHRYVTYDFNFINRLSLWLIEIMSSHYKLPFCFTTAHSWICSQNYSFMLAETLSKFGAGLFLLVQVLILLDFTHSWNDAWVAKDEQKWYVALLAVSVTCYLAAFTISGLLFIWFNPSGHDCGLNVFFLVMTMVLAFLFAVIALHPKVNGSLLPASVISVYCAYVCYTGLSSEPRDYECNGLHNKSSAVSAGTLILGMLTTVLSVVYSAVRAGSSTTFLSPPSSPRAGDSSSKSLLKSEDVEEGIKEDKKEKEARPVSYSYTFFHLIFALASMYSAMLLSGWTSSSSDGTELTDVGWTSVWVRICTEWVTAGLYVWTIVAPLLLPDREFY
ncbi:hypothetical protein QQ045_033019 [Rhodiola kirilowii]